MVIWLKFIFRALGSPLLFFLSLITITLAFPLQTIAPGTKTFNPLVYASFTIIVFGAITWLQYRVRRESHFSRFLRTKLSGRYLLLSAIGNINTVLWFTGMEINVFAFIVALPLALLALLEGFAELRYFRTRNAASIQYTARVSLENNYDIP